jgi:hypothetical protein
VFINPSARFRIKAVEDREDLSEEDALFFRGQRISRTRFELGDDKIGGVAVLGDK